MVFPAYFWLLFAVAMAVSAIGFKKYVWFISLGYGFSIAAEGLAMLILYGKSLSIGTVLCAVLFIDKATAYYDKLIDVAKLHYLNCGVGVGSVPLNISLGGRLSGNILGAISNLFNAIGR